MSAFLRDLRWRLTSRPWRLAGLAAFFLLLSLQFIHVPVTAVTFHHDPGSHMSFEFYAREKYQFGVDVIQNVGPYGYLQYPSEYSGLLPLTKLTFHIGFGFFLAFLTVRTLRFFATAWGKLIFAAGIALVPQNVPGWGDFDPLIYYFLMLAAHYLLTRERYGSHWGLDSAVLATLALTCLMKGTNLVLVGCLLTLVVFHDVRIGRSARAAAQATFFLAALMGLWMLAGQRLGNLPAFIKGIFFFTSGYNETMAYRAPQEGWLLAAALGYIVLYLLFSGWRLSQWKLYRARLPLVCFEMACLFVIWKHSFVRADHAFYFSHFAVSVAALLFLAHEANFAGVSPAGPRFMPTAATVLGLGLGVLGAQVAKGYEGFGAVWAGLFTRVPGHLWRVAHWPGYRAELDRMLQDSRQEIALPRIQQTVGRATVDEFGFFPGVPLLNGFNYHPRPMPISFAATTPLLMQRNASFYRDPTVSPAYVMTQIGNIDGRFTAQDDALAVLELMRRYEPMVAERGVLLLRRRPEAQADTRFTPLATRRVRWGEEFALPQNPSGRLWCTVKIQPSLLGRARSFLYKPAPVTIELLSHGSKIGQGRFLTCAGPAGFLARPLILDNQDLLSSYGVHLDNAAEATNFHFVAAGRDITWSPSSFVRRDADAFRFVCEGLNLECFEDRIEISFFTLE